METSSAVSSSSAMIPMSIYTLIFIGLIILQVFLSMAKNKRLGLILPILSAIPGFIVSLVMLFQLEATLIGLLILFFVMEIPAMIFLAVYFIVRAVVKDKVKETAQSELEKMNIQDL